MNRDHIILGASPQWGGQSLEIEFGPIQARQHLYIIGKTGSGKSTLMRNLILQHIALGHGIGVIDPHGDMAESLLAHIPPWRADHLCYFNPGDVDYPVSLNVLANIPRDEVNLVASGIVGAFKNIWPDSWGPRMEYIFHNAISALAECQNTTLLGLNRLLTDPAYRRWVIRQVKDPFVREFWEVEFEGYDTRFRREAIAPIQNKLGQFLQSPIVRNILGQVKSRIDMRFIMDDRRLFIANLSKGKLGHDKASLLGSLLVSQFQLAAMARSDQLEEERRDFYLFVDEFQNFVTEAFTSMLAEDRKYRLCLTLAHQFTQQIATTVRQAIFGNVGTLVSFRIGHIDAEPLHLEFAQKFAALQFVELPPFEAFVRLHCEGIPRIPFRMLTLPPLNPGGGRRGRLIARSRERFASSRSLVENKINRWLGNPLS